MNITPFQFDTSITIRTVTNDGDVLFVARDVAVALGYADPKSAVISHCKRTKSLKDIGVVNRHPYMDQALTLDPQTKLIPESDVYRLVMRSKLPSAERFQDWVMDEVLPALRQTGRYVAEPQFDIPQTLPEALRLAADLADRVNVLEQQTIEMLPKAEFYDNVADAKGLYTMSEAANILQIGRNTLFSRLRHLGIIKKLDRSNIPYQSYIDRGYFKVRNRFFDEHVSHTTYVTPRGLTYLHKVLADYA